MLLILSAIAAFVGKGDLTTSQILLCFLLEIFGHAECLQVSVSLTR